MRGADHRRELADRIICDTVCRFFCPCIIRVNLARFVFSQSCSALRDVVSRRLRIISLMLPLSAASSPCASHGDVAREVALGHGRGDVRDRAHLRGEVRGELVDVVRQIAPRARGAGHVGLAAEASFDADLARHRGDLIGEGRQRLDHVVDRVAQLRDLASRFDGELLLQIAFRDRGHDPGDAAHLRRQVRRPSC